MELFSIRIQRTFQLVSTSQVQYRDNIRLIIFTFLLLLLLPSHFSIRTNRFSLKGKVKYRFFSGIAYAKSDYKAVVSFTNCPIVQCLPQSDRNTIRNGVTALCQTIIELFGGYSQFFPEEIQHIFIGLMENILVYLFPSGCSMFRKKQRVRFTLTR